MEDLVFNIDDYLYYDKKELKKRVLYNAGLEDGIEQKEKEMIINLISKNMDDEFIQEVAQVDTSTIEAIRRELDNNRK